MNEILALSQKKVSDLTMAYNAAVEQGGEGTRKAVQLHKDLQQAQSALVRQQTITRLSTQDTYFFMGFIATQVAGLAIPAIQKLTQANEAGVTGFARLKSAITGVPGLIRNLIAPTAELGVANIATSSSLGNLGGMIGKLGSTAPVYTGALRGIASTTVETGTASASLASKFGVVGLAIAAAIAVVTTAIVAYQTNFLGFRDVTNNAAKAIVDFGNTVSQVLGAGWTAIMSDFSGTAGTETSKVARILPIIRS